MSKKQVTNADIVFDDTKIVLKSCFDKANIVYQIQPCPDKTGRFPRCVKKVDSHGDMILTETEKLKEENEEIYWIPENTYFRITHGTTFDLTDVKQRCEWEAIKNCPLIAKDRKQRDANGVPVIDGTTFKGDRKDFKITNGGRSGVAELYVDHPGMLTQQRVSRKQLVHQACSFIYEDKHGLQGHLNMARLLGRDMTNQPAADVLDYLITVAEEHPNKIIGLYTGTDTSLRLLFIEAREKNIIRIKNKLYIYGDDIVLGATDDAVLVWMKNPSNLKVLELIKKDTYPDLITE